MYGHIQIYMYICTYKYIEKRIMHASVYARIGIEHVHFVDTDMYMNTHCHSSSLQCVVTLSFSANLYDVVVAGAVSVPWDCCFGQRLLKQRVPMYNIYTYKYIYIYVHAVWLQNATT